MCERAISPRSAGARAVSPYTVPAQEPGADAALSVCLPRMLAGCTVNGLRLLSAPGSTPQLSGTARPRRAAARQLQTRKCTGPASALCSNTTYPKHAGPPHTLTWSLASTMHSDTRGTTSGRQAASAAGASTASRSSSRQLPTCPSAPRSSQRGLGVSRKCSLQGTALPAPCTAAAPCACMGPTGALSALRKPRRRLQVEPHVETIPAA